MNNNLARKIEECAQRIVNYSKAFRDKNIEQAKDMVETEILSAFDELENLIIEES